MDPDIFSKIYLGCIIVGLAIPVLQLIGGALGGMLDGLFDFDLDWDAETPLPMSLLSVCFTAVVFGVSGRICLDRIALVPGLVLSAIIGIIAGLLLQRLVIRPLRRSRPRALSIDDLLWTQGIVKLEIRTDFVGTITASSAIGSQVTYSARLAPWVNGPLRVGELVVVVEVDDKKNECVVSPLDQADRNNH